MACKLIVNPSGETIQTSKDESGTDDELARQQRNSEKQLASEQYSLRYVKAEENAFATSTGAARIATKAYKNWRRRDNCGTSKIVAPVYSGIAHPENKAGGARIFTQSNRQRNDPALQRDRAVRKLPNIHRT